MTDAGGPSFFDWASLAIALLALFWQAASSRRAASAGRLPPRTPFWAASGAWVLFGLLSHETFASRVLGARLGWLFSGAGLFAVALLRWSQVDLPSLMEEEASVAPAEEGAGEEEEEGLDSEGARLLRRIVRLRRKRAGELMVSIDRSPSLRIDDSRDTALALFEKTGALRVPVLDEKAGTVLGAVEARDFLAHAPVAGKGGAGADARPAFALRAFLRPVPSVNQDRNAGELLDILKRSPTGMSVVCDGEGALLGVLSWDQIFPRLLVRTAVEETHEQR